MYYLVCNIATYWQHGQRRYHLLQRPDRSAIIQAGEALSWWVSWGVTRVLESYTLQYVSEEQGGHLDKLSGDEPHLGRYRGTGVPWSNTHTQQHIGRCMNGRKSFPRVKVNVLEYFTLYSLSLQKNVKSLSQKLHYHLSLCQYHLVGRCIWMSSTFCRKEPSIWVGTHHWHCLCNIATSVSTHHCLRNTATSCARN